jgi:alpha-L-fucosidase 2
MQKMKQKFLVFLVNGIALLSTTCGYAQTLKLWYDRPATLWEETLPLGNGRLGMMPDGGVHKEKIVLNDITLWSGAPQDANKYTAHEHLPAIRNLLMQGKNEEAEALINKSFVCEGEGSGRGSGANVPFGCYQVLGNLEVALDYNGPDTRNPVFTDYTRTLSLQDAVASASFNINGVSYTREYFTSFSDDVDVVKFTASRKGALTGIISLDRPERFTTSADKDVLKMAGQLNNGTDGKGMQYEVVVKPVVKDGTVTFTDKSIVIKDATEFILYIAAATDFRNTAFQKQNAEVLKRVVGKPYITLKKEHIANYKKMFDRVSVDLGISKNEKIPTDKRLETFYKNPEADNGIPVLFYQFGRYLTISSTRVGLLPPNLQGLWANQVQTPWNGDYHLDVNVQMNHWPVEVSNLSELNLPLAELVGGMVKSGERTAKAYYNADGWVAHVITNIWGYTEPGEDASWGATTSGSGWLCNNLWEHYAYTKDIVYLKKIYPILKGSAQFYSSVLTEEPKNKWLVTAPSVSPENSFVLANGKHVNVCMGPTIDNQITRELFTNVIAASELLDTDKVFRETLRTKLSKLPPAGQIASDGRLMEWLEEYPEADKKHRHISHLYGLYPASLITPDRTPDLAEACRKTLEVRGDDSPGWSKAYKLLFWARLREGNRAYKLLKELLLPTKDTGINYDGGGGIYPNMLSAGPPFQIDGNFGGTAGIAEMLLQSHDGYIEFIPAIPDAWKSFGKVKGLKARGNFIVDFEWKNGVITSYSVASAKSEKVKIKIGGKVQEITARKL